VPPRQKSYEIGQPAGGISLQSSLVIMQPMDQWAAAEAVELPVETSWNLLKLTAKVTSRWRAAGRPPLAPGLKARQRSGQFDPDEALPAGEGLPHLVTMMVYAMLNWCGADLGGCM
jgi:hypothetical protein